MEPMLMMKTAAIVLTVSAVGGATMAIMRFSGKPQPPAWLAMLHGFLSGAAVTLLLYAFFTTGLPGLASIALALFVVAACGGVVLISISTGGRSRFRSGSSSCMRLSRSSATCACWRRSSHHGHSQHD